jgi:hypothetical protein
MIDFELYRNFGRFAIYSNVPIQYLDAFRYFSAKTGNFFRIRYRGPRNTAKDLATRNRITRQSSCLKENAKTFSVYLY